MKKSRIIVCVVIVTCLLIAFGGTVIIEWAYNTFGHLSMDEIIFHLKVPIEGTNTDLHRLSLGMCKTVLMESNHPSSDFIFSIDISNGQRPKISA